MFIAYQGKYTSEFLLNDIASRVSSETTEVLYGNDDIIKWTLETFSWVKERIEASIDNAGPAIHVISEPIWL